MRKLLIWACLLPFIGYGQIGRQIGVNNSAMVGDMWGTQKTWPQKMLDSYVSINSPYVAYTQVEKDTILGRLSQAYIVNTFGPSGLNKTTCDFFMIFWNSNTSTALATRTNTKTGSTLRWNYGGGNIYSQNNLPAQINNGIISVTSADGFGGWTILDLNTNNYRYKLPIGSLPTGLTLLSLYSNQFTGDWTNITLPTGLAVLYLQSNQFTGDWTNKTLPSGLGQLSLYSNQFTGDWTNKTLPSGLTILYLHVNQFTGDWTNKTLPTGLGQLYLQSNQFTGAPPNIAPHATNGLNYQAQAPNAFTTASNVTTFRKAMTVFNLQGNALPTAKVDELLHNMNLYYTANAPTQNCTINLSGSTMGIPTGGASNTDVQALIALWTAAGKTLTITVRTS